jgi:hypothetical protein
MLSVCRLRLEILEQRVLLTSDPLILTVGLTNDTMHGISSGPIFTPTPNTTGPLSLRDAVFLANQAPVDQPVTIILPAGGANTPLNYSLTRSPFDSQFNLSPSVVAGALQIRHDVTITSDLSGLPSQARIPVITASNLAAVFDIAGPIQVTIQNVAITGGKGDSSQGGGLRVTGGVDLNLKNVAVHDNLSISNVNQMGGGIYAVNAGGSIHIADSTFSNNLVVARRLPGSDQGSTAYGGAIYVNGGSLDISSSTFVGNRAIGGEGNQAGMGGSAYGGAIFVNAASLNIGGGSVFQSNETYGGFGGTGADRGGSGGSALGGAIADSAGALASFVLNDVSFLGNSAFAGSGGVGKIRGGNGGVAEGGAVWTTAPLQANNFKSEGDAALGGAGASVSQEGSGGLGGSVRGGALYAAGGPVQLTVGSFVLATASAGAGGRGRGYVSGVNGSQGGQGGAAFGGAIYLDTGVSLNANSVSYLSNVSRGGTGGFSASQKVGNGGAASGGAVYALDGAVTFTGADDSSTSFASNQATGGSGGQTDNLEEVTGAIPGSGGAATGGAVYAGGGLTVQSIVFGSNSAAGGQGTDGRVIQVFPDFTITEADPDKKRGRTATLTGLAGGDNGFAQGGAVWAQGTIRIDNALFNQNSATGGIVAESGLLAAGTGGRDGAIGLAGGRGGNALGGGLYTAGGSVLLTNSVFLGNQALAAKGGAGGTNQDGFKDLNTTGRLQGLDFDALYFLGANAPGGAGGAGGLAAGGAYYDAGAANIQIFDSTFNSNLTFAGAGGAAGPGVSSRSAGAGGAAQGGALAFASTVTGAKAGIFSTTIDANKLAGGDGGFGGNALNDSDWDTGGNGGAAGTGGAALGGGIYAGGPLISITTSTLSRNTASSGFGGLGGEGGIGLNMGGNGGLGGAAGAALGGGLALAGGSLNVSLSTIFGNVALAGFGGWGGDGGISLLQGGNGSDGGAGGDALGGGLWTASGIPASLVACTIANNGVESGGGGLPGAAGAVPGTPTFNRAGLRSYQESLSMSSRDVFLGDSLSQDSHGFTFPASTLAQPGTGQPSSYSGQVATGPLSTDALVVQTPGIGSTLAGGVLAFVQRGVLNYGTKLEGIAAGVRGVNIGGSTAFTSVGDLGSEAFSGGARAANTAALQATRQAAVASAGRAVSVASRALTVVRFFAGINPVVDVVVQVAVVVAVAFILGDGDFVDGLQQEAEASLLPPHRTNRTLDFFFTAPESDEIPPTPMPGSEGRSGRAGIPEGANLYVSAGTSSTSPVTAERTIFADGQAVSRSRTVATSLSGMFTEIVQFTSQPTDLSKAWFIEQTDSLQATAADVGGRGIVSRGYNFVGIATSGFQETGDQAGSQQSPSLLRSAGYLAQNGGKTLTLALQQNSPARNAAPADAGFSQNGYSLTSVSSIGAWGGTAPLPTAGSFSLEVNENSTVSLSFADILAHAQSTDGSLLTLSSLSTTAQNGSVKFVYPGDFRPRAAIVKHYTADDAFSMLRGILIAPDQLQIYGGEIITLDVRDLITDPTTSSLISPLYDLPPSSETDTRVLTYTPTLDFAGTDTLTYTVTSASGRSLTGTITIHVLPVNQRPSFTVPTVYPIPRNQIIVVGETPPAPTISVEPDAGPQVIPAYARFVAGPANEAGQSVLAYHISNLSDQTLFAVPPSIAPDGTLTFTPQSGRQGSATFQVTVQDSGGTERGGIDTSLPQTITIFIGHANSAPSFTATNPPEVYQDAGAQEILNWAVFAAGISDAGQQPLQYQVFNVSNPGLFSMAPSIDKHGRLTYVPAPGMSGFSTFTVIVQDDGGTEQGGQDTSEPMTFTITIAPTPIVLAPQAVYQPLTIQGQAPDQLVYDVANWAQFTSPLPGQSVTISLSNFKQFTSQTPTDGTFGGLLASAPTVGADGALHLQVANQQAFDLISNQGMLGFFDLTLRYTSAGGDVEILSPGLSFGAFSEPHFNFLPNIGIDPGTNNPPSFSAADVTVPSGAGAQTISGWSAFNPGRFDQDKGQNPIAYLVQNVSNSDAFAEQPAISADGTLTFTPAEGAFGDVTFEVAVQDDGGPHGAIDPYHNLSAFQTFTIHLGPLPNAKPSFTVPPLFSSLENAGAQTVKGWIQTFNPGALSEANQKPLAYHVLAVDNPGLFAEMPSIAPDGTLTFTPAPDAYGVATITLTVQDDGGTSNGGVDTSDTRTFSIVIQPVNHAPTFVASTTLNVVQGGLPRVITNWAAFVPGPANESTQQAIGFSVSNISNPGLFVQAPVVTPGGVLYFQLNPNAIGTTTFTVQVQDDGGTANGGLDRSVPQTITLVVTPGYQAASAITLSNNAVAEHAPAGTIIGKLEAESANPDDSYRFALLNNAGGRFALDAAGNVVVADSELLDYQTGSSYLVSIAAVDLGGFQFIQSFTINVLRAPNETPRSVRISSSLVPVNGAAGTIIGQLTAIDPDQGDIVTFTLLQDGDGAFALDGNKLVIADGSGLGFARNPHPVVIVRATDRGGLARDQTLVLTVANQAPGAQDNTLSVLENQSATGTLTAVDPGGAGVIFSIVTPPSHGTLTLLDATTGAYRYTPNADAVGSDFFRFTATNLSLSSNVGTVSIEIVAVNHAPMLNASNVTVRQDSGPQSIDQWATFSPGSPNETTQRVLAYAISNVSNPALFARIPFVNASGVLTFTPALHTAGTATFTVVVQDNGGTANGGQDLSLPQTFTITVTPVATPPSLSLPDVAGDETTTIPLNIAAVGLDQGVTESVSVVIKGVPAGIQLSAGTRTPGGDWVLSAEELVGLTLSAARGQQFTLTVSATATIAENGSTATTTGEQKITIRHVPPVLTLTGPAQVGQGRTYTLNFTAQETGDESLQGWTIAWGDGSVSTATASQTSLTHIYTDAPNYFLIQAIATDEAGSFAAPLQPVTVLVAGMTSGVGGVAQADGRPVTVSAQGVQASLVNNTPGSPPLTLFAGSYGENPTNFEPGAGLSYADVRVGPSNPGDQLTVAFFVPPERSNDRSLHLTYFDGQRWQPVRGSTSNGPTTPTLTIKFNEEGSFASAYFLVVLDETSSPKLSKLHGTPFGISEQLTRSQLLVTQFYRDLLDRPVEPAGLQFWSNLLDRGLSNSRVAFDIQRLPEYQANQITAVFQDYLGRAPELPALSFYSSFLANGGTADEMKAQILGSSEYFEGKGESSNPGFVGAIFQSILARQPESEALAYYDSALEMGASRHDVASSLLRGVEAKAHLIDTLYEEYLHREGSAEEKAFHIANSNDSSSDELTVAAFLGSDEYWSNL